MGRRRRLDQAEIDRLVEVTFGIPAAVLRRLQEAKDESTGQPGQTVRMTVDIRDGNFYLEAWSKCGRTQRCALPSESA